MAETKLNPTQSEVSTRFKVIATTRDMAGTTADVAYTGVGFKPSSIICFSGVEGTVLMSFGASDSAGAEAVIEQYYGGNATTYNYLVGLDVSAGNQQMAVLKTYDADGFTLTWTKIGTPTGTIKLVFLCFR